jgi:hypothetical protein
MHALIRHHPVHGEAAVQRQTRLSDHEGLLLAFDRVINADPNVLSSEAMRLRAD